MPTPPPTPPYDTDQTGTTGSDNYPGTPGRDRYVGLDGADNLRGGDGDDVLIGDGGDDFIQGQNGDDYLEGGDGIDNLRGGNGDDTILGGAGDDLIRGGAGVDIIDGGDGNDRISFFDFDATQGVVADLATQTMANDGYGNSETFTSIEGLGSGTRFVDTLLGSDGANILLGNAEDIISGRGGDDLIQIGASATGGGTFDGGDGIDTLNFIDGYLADTNGDGIAEVVPTTVGVTVNLTAPTNQIQSDGNGRQATILNIENLGGTAFNDRLIGNGGNNTLIGNLGNDVLVGLGGNNILQGGLGSDVLVDLLAGTNDVLDGGEETDPAIIDLDYVSYFDPNLGSTGVTVSLALQGVAQTTGRGDDTLTGIEGLAGTRFADVLTGDDFNNALFGMGGADTISAAGGDDAVVVSGFGSVIDGGAGNDVIAFWSTAFSLTPNEIPGGVTYDLSLGGPQASAGGTLTISNVENISGSRADDVFTGTVGDNVIGGSYGSDTLNGGDGDDALYGDGTFSFNAATGEVSYIDEVIAPPGQPAFGVAAGDDVLNGGAGDDELFGGAGDDTLTGGAGFDTVFGGDGDDEYHFNIATDDVDQVNLEGGSDVAFITGNGNQTRITFSIGQAANGSPVDTITGPAFDGGLGLRVQAEDAAGNLVGGVSRFDDEGMTLATADGSTSFDIRILESGQTLGVFGALSIGTLGDDTINLSAFSVGAAILGGAGNDSLTGTSGNDYIQGGAGVDTLSGGDGNDALVDGGGGNKTILGGAGQDRFFFNIMANGANSIDLGESSGSTGIDIVNIQGPSNIPQIRLTLDVAAAGNGVGTRGDGSLAVEIQREDANGNLIGAISRGDDEHILYNSPVGSVGFDIRDSVSGEFLGLYSFAYLGSAGADIDTALSPTRSYFYSLGGGDDQVTGGQLSDYMDGGIGNDVLSGGLGNDKLLGRDGDDLLTGGEGNDTIDGGAGADVAVFAKASSSYAVVSDGAGGFLVIDRETLEQDVVSNVETLRFSDGDFTPASIALNRIVVNPAGSPNANGSPNGDYILGDERTNVLNGQGGNDFVDGRGNPSPGQQLIRGQAGNDTLVGGEGDDQLRGGQGVDRFFGGNGFDRISLFEVDATQAVSANLITQTINNDGFGNVEQMSSIEALGAGTRFADTFIGNDVRNLFLGDSSDTITANGGDDDIQLSGSTAGGGVIDGGDGVDFITFFTSDKQEDTNGDGIADSVTTTVGVTIDLSQNRILNDGFGNTATLINVEGVTGGSLSDTLTGNDGDNRFGMTLGSDVIDGRGGIDVIDTGNDARAKYNVVATATGYTITFTDTVFVINPTTGASEPQTVTATTSVVNVERIRFAEGEFNLADIAAPSTTPTIGNDTITGTTGADIINALAGDDVIDGLAGDDSIDGGDGTDVAVFAKASTSYAVVAEGAGFLVIDRETLEQDFVVNVETLRFSNGDFTPASVALNRINLPAGTTNDGRNGTPAGDYIVGNDGYNVINGQNGDDFILAGGNGGAEPSVDQIRGNNGNDTLVGGAGADLFRGGAGVDRFFGQGGNDRISFFEATATQGVIADLETGTISNDGFGNVEYFSSIEGLGGSTRFADVFRGDSGNNLFLADTADTVEGRGGDDRFQLSGSVGGGGVIDGGDGFDVLYALTADRQEDTNGDGISDSVAATQGVTIDLALGQVLNDGFGNTATLISIEGIGGGALNDTLLGSAGNDQFSLSNGNDFYDGRDGTDTLSVEGSASTDFVVTRIGANSYRITDTTGANAVLQNIEFARFSNGTFALSALNAGPGAGDDYIEGTTGNDTLDGLGGNDTIEGLQGDDTLSGGDGDDVVNGGIGLDTIDGGAGSDTLNGGDQNDTITAGSGADTVNGGNGNDLVITGDSDGAADSYNGANGSDTISYRTNTAGVTVNLALQGSAQDTGSEGMDTLNAFENLEGGSGNDVLTGNNLPNRINGLGGDDILSGGGFVNPAGGLSPNLLDGGDGYDIAVFAGNRADYEFQYVPATGRLNVIPLALSVSDGLLNIEAVRFDDGTFLVSQLNAIPTEGDDLINGARFTDTIDGLGGNDTINGRAAPDTLNGGEGNDTLNGGDDNDTLDGGNGDDTVNGDAGNDTATGGAGTDTVNGGAGDDTLDGGAGNDIVRGGDGNDTITDGTGGSGNQLFGDAGDDVISTTGGLNTINGGTGNDTVNGGNGTDVITHDLLTGGADRYNTGGGFDFVTLTMAAGSEARITFTSSEVGNGSATDSGALANQDGDLAVRIQLEGNTGGLTGPVSRGDDEGVFYTASEGSTIEIRDLVSGVSRGSFRTSFLGTSGNDTVTAQGAFADQSYYMNGGMGNDTLTGSTVADFLVGGAGDDTLSGGSGNDQFLGGDGNDTVNGDGGDDIITGGLGNDVINGGLGNDTAIFNIATDGADSIDLGSGADVVQLSGAGQIRLTLTTGEVGNGSVNDSNSLANQDGGLALRIQAEDGSDGLTGAISRSDDEGITLVAAAGTTFDVRDLPTGATRGDSFNVVMLGTSAASESLTASNLLLSYYINGGNGRDIITGGAVADVLEGGADIDVIDGGEGDDVVLGGSGVDQLFGGIGNDRLDGGADNDFLTGGLGNDTYVTDGTDVITEQVGEGIDEVIASLNYALSANVENLTLVGAAINGDGNELGNVITGNANANLLRGLDGNDLLIGGDGADNLQGNNGNDTLNGGEGDDVLDGGAAGDIMIGGNGNDIYTVDAVSDQVIETAGGGTNDRVTASVSYTLVGEIEVLNLVGAAALVGIGSATNNTINGNEFANTLYGNDGNDTLVGNAGDDSLFGGNGTDVLRGGEGNDVLDGGVGADSMSGGNGDDLYYIDSVADVIGESAGGGTNDRALVSVNNYVLAREVETATLTGTDNFALTGNVSANTLNGNSGNNLIRGGDGNDTILGNDGNDTLFGDAGADLLRGGNGTDILNGGLGSDQLQGGAGADIFRFASVADLGLTGATTDRVLDFTAAQGDRIDLSAIDANVNVAGDQAFSFIGTAAFSGTAGELRVQASGTNQLVFGDVNGDGIADFLIVVTPTGAVPLANGDFTL